MSTGYSATVRVEIVKRDVRVTIFGEREQVSLLDSFLRSRIAGLVLIEEQCLNTNVRAVEYEDCTGKDFNTKS